MLGDHSPIVFQLRLCETDIARKYTRSKKNDQSPERSSPSLVGGLI